MALFDIFKKKPAKSPQKQAIRRARKFEKPVSQVVAKPKKIFGAARLPSLGAKATSGQAYKVLKGPHVTERATDLVQKNQYVFKVFSQTNKTEIKGAIKDLYGVDVVSVRIINVPRRKRRLGKIEGWRKGYKKAIVRIKEGQKIEVLPR